MALEKGEESHVTWRDTDYVPALVKSKGLTEGSVDTTPWMVS